MPTPEHRIAPPGRHLLFLEGRALLGPAALVPAYPLLRRAPRDDGHPVIVLPGFMASDFSTRALRRFLHGLGYAVHGWEAGRNVGPSPELATRIVAHLQDVRTRHGRRVSLVGWSLGGIYARELARRFADDVRQVITLASPFRDVEATNVPRLLRDLARRRPLPDETELPAHPARPTFRADEGHLQPHRRHRRVAELPARRGRNEPEHRNREQPLGNRPSSGSAAHDR